jgi:hypothetical protein
MEQKYPSRMKLVLLGVSFLLVLASFSGCTQDSAVGDSVPISVTVHSTYKTGELNGVTAKPGTDFVVVNMTLENHGGNPYTFNEKAVILNGAPPVEETVYTRITSHRYWGRIPAGEKRTGEIIFGAKNTTHDFTLTFFYNKGQDSITQELGNVPKGPHQTSIETQPGSDNSTPALDVGNTASQSPVSLTIYSVEKRSKVGISSPLTGHIFVVFNVTIKNNDLQNGFYLIEESTVLKDLKSGYYINQSFNGKEKNVPQQLENPILLPITIRQNETRSGQILFAVTDSDTYRMTLIGPGNTILAKKRITFPADGGKVTVTDERE